MISHKDCAHESSSKARAACRKARAKGETLDYCPWPRATPREVDLTSREEKETEPFGSFKPQTPRDRDQACDNCGVERIKFRGTDPITNTLKYVGSRCEYIVRHAPDRMSLGKKAKRGKMEA